MIRLFKRALSKNRPLLVWKNKFWFENSADCVRKMIEFFYRKTNEDRLDCALFYCKALKKRSSTQVEKNTRLRLVVSLTLQICSFFIGSVFIARVFKYFSFALSFPLLSLILLILNYLVSNKSDP